MPAADQMRNAIILRRLAAIPGLTGRDLMAVTEPMVAHITDQEARELLAILDAWPDDS